MKNLILIGMPGAGKSTLGVLLAKTLNMNFVDTDLLLQQTEGRLLQEIIDHDGIEQFLAMEAKMIQGLHMQNHVIATGGSVVCSEDASTYLKNLGQLVYLELEYAEVEKRIQNIKSRGIAMSPGENLRDVYCKREPLYEKYADITINCTGKDAEIIVEEIASKIY